MLAIHYRYVYNTLQICLQSFATEGGKYYRIGACPYLSNIIVFCPCKGQSQLKT